MCPRNQDKRRDLLLPLFIGQKNQKHGGSVRTKKSIVNSIKVGDQYPNFISKRASKVKQLNQKVYLGIGRESIGHLC